MNLATVRSKTLMLTVSCEKCGRYGRLNLDRLIAEHGPDYTMLQLRADLTSDCPRMQRMDYSDACLARFPQLVTLF